MSPWAALGRGKQCQSMTRRRTAMMKRYTRRGADAAALTAAWAGPWAGAAVGAAGEGTGNVNAVARGRGVSPHAQTAAHTTCPHVLPRSHLSNPVKMKVRLTKSGIEKEDRENVFCGNLGNHLPFYLPSYYQASRLLEENKTSKSALVNCQSKQNLPATAKSKLTQVNLSERAINLL